MKNKYQEALNNIMDWLYPRYHIAFKNELNTLQELVDKETPLKVIKEIINDSYDYNDRDISFEWERIKCPKCNEDLVNEYEDRDWDNNDICPFCGQKLDWSDDNE